MYMGRRERGTHTDRHSRDLIGDFVITWSDDVTHATHVTSSVPTQRSSHTTFAITLHKQPVGSAN